jgi:hypothetical protein
MLLWSKVRVIDLAGLCDAEIAGLRSRDPTAERQYIFADVRPTFIHTYGIWSRTVEFEKDQRLARDYEAIHAYTADEDPKSDGHASGIFIRRDALVGAGGEASLEAFRREPHNRLAFLRPERPSVFRRWLESTALVPQEYRADSSANTKENKDIR